MAIEIGDVVQIDPASDERFGGSFMQVTEVKPWGVKGFVPIPATPRPQMAFYRCEFQSLAKVGPASWIHRDLEADAAAAKET